MTIKHYLMGIIVNILSLFDRKKRNSVVLVSPDVNDERTPLLKEQIQTASSSRNIALMIDEECVSLYGREPLIFDALD